MYAIEHKDLKLRIVPQTPGIGAVVEGVDAHQPLAPEAVRVLKNALLEYKVIFFPEQALEREEQQAFADHFGEPFLDPINQVYDDGGAPGLTYVSRVDHFHSDLTYMAKPPSFSMLQMNVTPPVGGDTMWSDQIAAYEALSPIWRNFLDPLVVEHVVDRWFWSDQMIIEMHEKSYGERLSPERVSEVRQASEPHEHPLVCYIPETGKRSLYLSARFARSIRGLSKAESDAVLQMLFVHQLNPKFVFRYRWHAGDIAFWDHRTTIHAGIGDYGDQERHGQRASIAPEAVSAIP